MTTSESNVTEDQAREVLGLDEGMWTVQLTDEELRMLQEIMKAEKDRRVAIFDDLLEKIVQL